MARRSCRFATAAESSSGISRPTRKAVNCNCPPPAYAASLSLRTPAILPPAPATAWLICFGCMRRRKILSESVGGSDQDSERAPSGAKEVGTVARVVNHYENRYLRPGMRDSANLMESEIAKRGKGSWQSCY